MRYLHNTNSDMRKTSTDLPKLNTVILRM
jgi:hypothetical protein